MKLKYIAYSALIALLPLTSCNDFLDKTPDNRVELNSPAQLALLMVNGYPSGNYANMCEMSSDNYIDNTSPDESGNRYNLPAYDRIDDELFAWEDAKSSTGSDSPSDVWEKSYHAIAVANAVLDKVVEFEAKGMKDEVAPMKGEALLIRSYNHFILANLFCQPYRGPELSKSIQGIPYMTKSEDVVLVHYERKDLASVYEQIEEDLLAGLPLIDESLYDVPKYHFNKNAANAFAARFFLFKRDYPKVIKYATEAFGGEGGNPASMFMDIC